MRRTALRPLAAGHLQSGQALIFALWMSICGLVYLYVFVNHLTSLLAVIVLACYIFLYTPLKTRTWLCTMVGAVPGAFPIVMAGLRRRGRSLPGPGRFLPSSSFGKFRISTLSAGFIVMITRGPVFRCFLLSI